MKKLIAILCLVPFFVLAAEKKVIIVMLSTTLGTNDWAQLEATWSQKLDGDVLDTNNWLIVERISNTNQIAYFNIVTPEKLGRNPFDIDADPMNLWATNHLDAPQKALFVEATRDHHSITSAVALAGVQFRRYKGPKE